MTKATFLNVFTQYLFMAELTLITTRTLHWDGIVKNRRLFPIPIEDLDGSEKTVQVRFVPHAELYQGQLGRVDHDSSAKNGFVIEIRRGTNPILTPIIAQMLYFQHQGTDEQSARIAALIFGYKVLNNKDTAELAAVLGLQSQGIVIASDVGGDSGFYERHLVRYLKEWEKIGSHAKTAAALAEYGLKEAAREWGVAPIAANAIISDTRPIRMMNEGSPEVIPAPGSEIPAVIGVLENLLMHLSYDENRAQRMLVTDPFTLRILYAFSDDCVSGGPVKFEDKEESGSSRGNRSSTVIFTAGAKRTIVSVVKHLKAKVANESRMVDKLLSAARKELPRLENGETFGGLLAAVKGMPANDYVDLIARVKEDIGKLERRKRGLADILAGKIKKPDGPAKQTV